MPENNDAPPTENKGAEVRLTELEMPTDASKNVEITKYYTFNETGNIMMATTVGASAEIEESVRKVFSEVSVFFAAMTKAISLTENPATKKPYSLYNYEALEKIITGSGCFIRVTEQDVFHKTDQGGAKLGKELLQGLLGLATGAGALSFASAMISSIGKESVNLAAASEEQNSKVGNIIFVCEYLMGMPSISAIVVYLDARAHKKEINAGPCFKAQSKSLTFTMHKDTYMFVTPTFIHEYAADLNSIGSDAAYGDLIKTMREHLQAKATG